MKNVFESVLFAVLRADYEIEASLIKKTIMRCWKIFLIKNYSV